MVGWRAESVLGKCIYAVLDVDVFADRRQWIDREAGLCGLFATQIMPTGDEKTVELQQAFERAMYQRYYAAMSGME